MWCGDVFKQPLEIIIPYRDLHLRVFAIGGYGCFHEQAKEYSQLTGLMSSQTHSPYQILDTCEMYAIDPNDTTEAAEEKKNRKWFTLSSLPKPRMDHGAVCVGKRLYVMGGRYSNSTTDGEGVTADACVLNINKNKNIQSQNWEPIAAMNRPRATFGVGVADGQIFVWGGVDSKGRIVNDMEIYTPHTEKWITVKAEMQVPRSEFGWCSFKDANLWTIGSGTGSTVMEHFDVNTAEWNRPGSIHRARPHAVAIAFERGDKKAAALQSAIANANGTDTKIGKAAAIAAHDLYSASFWLVGGVLENGEISADVDTADMRDRNWRTAPAMVNRRSHHAATVMAGRIVVAGGFSKAVQSSAAFHAARASTAGGHNIPPAPVTSGGSGGREASLLLPDAPAHALLLSSVEYLEPFAASAVFGSSAAGSGGSGSHQHARWALAAEMHYARTNFSLCCSQI